MSDYPEPDPTPPPLPVFNPINWPQIEVPGTGGGGGGGGGGKSYQETILTLTGNAENVEFNVPANTTQIQVSITSITSASGFPISISLQLGDSTSYYTTNYYSRNSLNVDRYNTGNQTTSGVAFFLLNNQNTQYFIQSTKMEGISNPIITMGSLVNITTEITRLKILTGNIINAFAATTTFTVTYLIIP